jgi:predicted AlkP superfamily pyrophosphatase or phosphodiesterase
VAGFANPLAIEPAARICLLLVDGLGWELLLANPRAAPFLNSIAREPLTTGFPATTAASLTSLATGVPPGEHGLVGYTMALPGYERAFNTLSWSLYGVGPRVDLVNEVVPEAFQPIPTLAERSAAAGLRIHHLGPAFHEWSGLTRAIGRGERFHPADSLEAVAEGTLRLLEAPRAFVFGYHPRLDAAGHVHGVASQDWKDELVAVEQAARLLAEQLPADALLVISGDHGMVDLRPAERLDLADHPDLAPKTCSAPGDPGWATGCGSGRARRRSRPASSGRGSPSMPANALATSWRRPMVRWGSFSARSTRRRPA